MKVKIKSDKFLECLKCFADDMIVTRHEEFIYLFSHISSVYIDGDELILIPKKTSFFCATVGFYRINRAMIKEWSID